jgi:2',3'-cyclic-nucleotide 2'-phosphodiesterase (5'-nucleotidase family)
MKTLQGLLPPTFYLMGFVPFWSPVRTAESFSVARQPHAGGGRAPGQPNKIDTTESWEVSPRSDSECRLIICQITDVYTLENLAHFKTLIAETKKRAPGSTVVSMLTGDFLSPYLLSSVDKGAGMMHALNSIPLDYLCWGNHEADIEHHITCRHVRNFHAKGGKFINSNMLDHDAMDAQQEYDVIELKSEDGTNTRRVGLTAVLSDDPALYSHFKGKGAFGGATLTDPWEALTKYKKILEDDEKCDVVIPLQHLYVPDDHKTCEQFDFPLILSGHDHHIVDEVVEGTRLIKPGMNADFAAVVEISWNDATEEKPKIRSQFVRCKDWAPDPVMAEENERAYDSLLPLRNTELARIPSYYEPLTSNNSRGSVCSMGKYICSVLKSAFNMNRGKKNRVDAVLIMGGNVRGNADYPIGSYFSLEALEAEIKSDETVGVISMPGWLLAEGIEATHCGDPIPGWFQYDVGIQQDENNVVTHVAGLPIDRDRMYRVATKIGDLTNGQSPPFTEYYQTNPKSLPPKGNYVNIQSEMMSYFARNLWKRLWDAISHEVEDTCDIDGNCSPEDRLDVLDSNGDGTVTVEEIHNALRDLLDYSVDDRETTLAEFVHAFADTDGSGKVTVKDFEVFCDDMAEQAVINRALAREAMERQREIAAAAST